MSNEPVFRKKSIDRISSPEQLNDYIRVSTPGVWIVLVAILLVMGGLIFWGIFGRVTQVAVNGSGEVVSEEIAPITYVIN